jgi:predicted Zn-dependent protease
VTRPELFERSAARRPIRVHDLRATFVTVALAAGRSEAWVTARTGHRSSGQVANYRRTAATFAELSTGWFVHLAAAIPELAAAIPAAETAAAEEEEVAASDVSSEKCTGGDLNPYASRRWNLKATGDVRTRRDQQERASRDSEDTTRRDASQPPLPDGAAGSALEAALARAITKAAEAGRFDVVAQLARQLEARRVACEPNVVVLPAKSHRR